MLTIKQIFDKLNEMEYLTVGGIASMLYGVPRNTFDIDIMIFYTDTAQLLQILKELGYNNCVLKDTMVSISEVTPQKMIESRVVMFINGVKIDAIILGELDRRIWNEVYNRGVLFEQEGTTINTIDIADLIELKRSTGRPKDLEDVKLLTEIMERVDG